MIHTTIGVYNNGDRVINGVPSENLAFHLKYNIFLRPGRALFLDGHCIHRGYLSKERVEAIETELKGEPVIMIQGSEHYR